MFLKHNKSPQPLPKHPKRTAQYQPQDRTTHLWSRKRTRCVWEKQPHPPQSRAWMLPGSINNGDERRTSSCFQFLSLTAFLGSGSKFPRNRESRPHPVCLVPCTPPMVGIDRYSRGVPVLQGGWEGVSGSPSLLSIFPIFFCQREKK